jgi:3-deoxy-D-manno-octulosonic-acid transferase
VHYLIYNSLLTVTFIAVLPFLPLWLMLRPRARRGLAERFGWYEKVKLKGLTDARAIWIHAASVGETLAAATLIAALKTKVPDCKIILSTFTDTGNEMARRCAGADVVIFLPLDHPLILRRVWVKLEPAVLIVIETEIWPNLLQQASRRGIPAVLLSGRFSPRAFNRYLRFRGFFRSVLRGFAACGMQSAEDADRITRLGIDAARVVVTGNLKQAAAMPGIIDASEGQTSAAGIKRPLLVAGSTHRGEETMLLEVFSALKKRVPGLQLALAPRHPERFAEVERLLLQTPASFVKKTRIDGALTFDDDVLLVDTLGDLTKIYALADIAFVGGSLVDVGGHNPLEPARLRKPLLFGPFMANFRTLADAIRDSGGAIEVRSAEDLLSALDGLLNDPVKRRIAGEAAYRAAMLDGAVMERSLELLARYIDFKAQSGFRGAHQGNGRRDE